MELFTKVAVCTPAGKVADVTYNCDEIIRCLDEAQKAGAAIAVFPELAVTGYTCADLFFQRTLLEEAKEGLFRIAAASRAWPVLAAVGYPLLYNGKMYNTAAILCRGRIIGFVPKKNLPNYGEFYEARWFTPGQKNVVDIPFERAESEEAQRVPFGMNLLFREASRPELCIAAELCEDVWVGETPATAHAKAGASVIINCSASDEVVGKAAYRRQLIAATSARLCCAYLYANAGAGESSQDLVFGGHNLICENGLRLAESQLYHPGITYAEIDTQRLFHDRMRCNTWVTDADPEAEYRVVSFSLEGIKPHPAERSVSPYPFVPIRGQERNLRCEEILNMQAMGLARRLKHLGNPPVVVGISGGLDSTLALLVAVRAFDFLKQPRDKIVAITMPAFGTTDRTYQNALQLIRCTGAALREINIKNAVAEHFAEIKHDPDNHNVVYENAQARERTQVLMDVANAVNGIVIGTGDMSELALGWATYNGDHMSMYGVNVGVPKTLVRYLVQYVANTCVDSELTKTLLDILDTPVSPELLPPTKGMISQRTEDLVGPYALHDFFLYYMLRYGYPPTRIYALATYAFSDRNDAFRQLGKETDASLHCRAYDKDTVRKWLRVFYRRFFAQQFKRSCLPDGPKIGTVALSPRGDLRMSSDAAVSVWMREIDEIERNCGA